MELQVAIDGCGDVLQITSVEDLKSAASVTTPVDTLLIQPKDPSKYLDLKDEFMVLTSLIRLRQVKTLYCHKVNLEHAADRRISNQNLESLHSATFESCANCGFIMRYLMMECPNLRSLREIGPKLENLPHRESNREVSQTTTLILAFLENHYSLVDFYYDRLEERIVKYPRQSKPPGKVEAAMNAAFERLLDTQRKISECLERNRKGQQKCRTAIYQLFLIEGFAVGDPFKALNRDVLRIIAKMLYSTIGTKIWVT